MARSKFQLSRRRHIAKTITWRILASTDTFLISWLLTGNYKVGGSIAGIEIVTKTFLYYAHERVWYQSKFGIFKKPFLIILKKLHIN